MSSLPRYIVACLETGRLALLAIMVSGGIVLQVLVSIFLVYQFNLFGITDIPYGQTAVYGRIISTLMILQACALYSNWWPMLTAIMYVPLPMPLLFFMGSESSSVMPGNGNSWVNFTKFLTGASVIGSIAIPCILKHANVICWGALAMELSSFLVFAIAIVSFLQMNNQDEYSMF